MGEQKVWQEDDAAYDVERLEAACLRIVGKPLAMIKHFAHRQKGYRNLGDAEEFVVDVGDLAWRVISSYPGANAIYKNDKKETR